MATEIHLKSPGATVDPPPARGFLAQMEREQVGERVRAAMDRVAREGRPRSRFAPFGWRTADGSLEAMPGVQIVDWETVHVDAQAPSWREAAATMAGYLGNLPADVKEISTRRVKKECGLTGLTKHAFQMARDEALQQVSGWNRVKGSFRRSDF